MQIGNRVDTGEGITSSGKERNIKISDIPKDLIKLGSEK